MKGMDEMKVVDETEIMVDETEKMELLTKCLDLFRTMYKTKTYLDKEALQKINIDPGYDIAVMLDDNKKIRPRELFTKLQQDRITFKESILLLNYVFQKILLPKRSDYFTATAHHAWSPSSPTSMDFYDYTYLTFSCDEEQYKNRLRFKAFLDTVKKFKLLETPEFDN